ncbi:MAG TPA: Lrp/AsnC family transcriptional regulator [Acidimicrobiales bacterium]|nr:Lrp/AsnC family transcriptional regulator [Acidimicrobiales bacterium]
MPGRTELDQIDWQILDLLQADGRRSLSDIGQRIGLSTSAVKRRVDRLESSGVITGYTAIVDHRQVGRTLEAFTELRFSGNASVEEIRAALADLPEAMATFVTAGDPDAVVWLRVDGPEGLRRTIETLRRGGKVIGTKTLMVMESWWHHSSRPELR